MAIPAAPAPTMQTSALISVACSRSRPSWNKGSVVSKELDGGSDPRRGLRHAHEAVDGRVQIPYAHVPQIRAGRDVRSGREEPARRTVVAAPPGIVSYPDLPLPLPRGLVRL